MSLSQCGKRKETRKKKTNIKPYDFPGEQTDTIMRGRKTKQI